MKLFGNFSKKKLFLVAGFLVILSSLTNAAQAVNPLPGQIIVDPNSPSWFVYNKDGNGDGRLDPFFMCGPGDPEGFLYRGTRNADGTRNGDQMELIDKLKSTGANSIYFQAVRSHGGDGDSTQNPFIDSDPTKGIDQDILDQWETWFTEMDNNGIVIFFFFYDDSARIWDSGDSVGTAEKNFIDTLVDRFEHHKHLIWVVAEEYQERYTAQRVSNIAAQIRSADDYNHPIAVHKLSGLSFSEFADDPNVDQFAIQYKVGTVEANHQAMIEAWNRANGKYNLNLAEPNNDYGSVEFSRQRNWAVAMGSAYIMPIEWDIKNTLLVYLEDCGRLVRFMESTNVNQMAPHDELAFGGTQYVLAKPGQSYIAYASNLLGNIGLKNMTADTYDFKWYDATNGNTAQQMNLTVGAGDQTFSKPGGIGNELAVFIRRMDDTVPIVTPTLVPTPIPTSGTTYTRIYSPVADTYVEERSPSTNLGVATSLKINGPTAPSQEMITYLRFNITETAPAKKALLKLRVTNSGLGGEIYTSSDISWDELAVTYDFQPVVDGVLITKFGSVSSGSDISLDVTSAIISQGLLTLVMRTDATDGSAYSSKEAANNQPALEVTFSSTHCQPLGDIDCSGKVNALDLSVLLSVFGTADAAADLDNSGKVNALDLSILLSNFGKGT